MPQPNIEGYTVASAGPVQVQPDEQVTLEVFGPVGSLFLSGGYQVSPLEPVTVSASGTSADPVIATTYLVHMKNYGVVAVNFTPWAIFADA